MTTPLRELELEITALAAGGDGVARDASGRVTFVPRTAPGDRVRARITKATKSFARAELIEVRVPGPGRVAPSCPAFVAGCGGCQWLHVARADQLAAKQAIVAGALRKLAGLTVHPIADPCPPLGWRRRARFHAQGGVIGLYREGTHDIVPLARCPQLAPALDDALAALAADPAGTSGEVALLLGHTGEVAIGTQRDPGPPIEVEPGLWGRANDFAQASAAGNAALVACVRAAIGPGPGALLELYAGAGNFTRGLVADGWTVTASDAVLPARPVVAQFIEGAAEDVVARVAAEVSAGPARIEVVVLDPPRAGAAAALDGIAALAPRTIVYVSCDPATLARDAERLAPAGYRATDAWPIDLMPQTSHVEVVMKLSR